MKKSKYYLILENESSGYILEEVFSLDLAHQRADDYEANYIGKLNSSLQLQNSEVLASYKHYDRIALQDRSVRLFSDGFNTLYVLPLPIDYNISLFVKSRISHQYVFDFIKQSDVLMEIYDRRGISFNAMVN